MSYADVLFGGIKTYEDWGLKLENVQLSFPDAKTDLVDIQGANGVIDLTEVNGPVCYGNRTLTLTFSLLGDYTEWYLLASKIAKELHGKVKECILPDEPNFYYEGRFKLQTSKDTDVVTDVVITGDVEPYKKELLSSVDDWLWDPFSFKNGVIREYAGIAVNGSAEITVLGSEMPVVPKIIPSDDMDVEFDGKLYHLLAGENTEYDIVIMDEDVTLKFTGNGTVSIEYRGGIL